MNADFQTPIALAVVAVTVLLLVRRLVVRRARRGCGSGNCGPSQGSWRPARGRRIGR